MNWQCSSCIVNPYDIDGGSNSLRTSTGFTQFSFSELKTATKDFSDKNVIGKGGSATVYKVLYITLLNFIMD